MSTYTKKILSRAKQGRALKDVFILDAHGHMGLWYNFYIPKDGTAKSMIEEMDYLGINKVCVSAHLSIGPDYKLGNNLISKAIKENPDRFIGYAVVNPNYPEDVEKELKRCFENLGMKAIKLHASMHNYSVNGANYSPVWEYAKKYNCPVLSHIKNVEAYAKLCKKYPDVNFILAHAGSISDTFHLDRLIEIAKKFNNLYLDLTGSVPYFGIIEKFVKEVGPERVLYGSDIPFIDAAGPLGRVLYAKIKDEDKEKILGLNMAKLLDINILDTI